MSDDRQRTSDEWTAMVKQRNHRAKLERVAREWLDGLKKSLSHYRLPTSLNEQILFAEDIVLRHACFLIASTEQRVLEGAIEKIGRRINWYSNTVGVDQLTRNIQINEAQGCIELLRQQAKERGV